MRSAHRPHRPDRQGGVASLRRPEDIAYGVEVVCLETAPFIGTPSRSHDRPAGQGRRLPPALAGRLDALADHDTIAAGQGKPFFAGRNHVMRDAGVKGGRQGPGARAPLTPAPRMTSGSACKQWRGIEGGGCEWISANIAHLRSAPRVNYLDRPKAGAELALTDGVGNFGGWSKLLKYLSSIVMGFCVGASRPCFAPPLIRRNSATFSRRGRRRQPARLAPMDRRSARPGLDPGGIKTPPATGRGRR